MEMYVGCRATGEVIVKCRSFVEGLTIIKDFEEEDRNNGCFTKKYYGIFDEKNELVRSRSESNEETY